MSLEGSQSSAIAQVDRLNSAACGTREGARAKPMRAALYRESRIKASCERAARIARAMSRRDARLIENQTRAARRVLPRKGYRRKLPLPRFAIGSLSPFLASNRWCARASSNHKPAGTGNRQGLRNKMTLPSNSIPRLARSRQHQRRPPCSRKARHTPPATSRRWQWSISTRW